MKSRKLSNNKKRTKKTEADLACFKLIINNQGQFVIEQSLYPQDKISFHFKKENSGLVNALLRESKLKFQSLIEDYETILKNLA